MMRSNCTSGSPPCSRCSAEHHRHSASEELVPGRPGGRPGLPTPASFRRRLSVRVGWTRCQGFAWPPSTRVQIWLARDQDQPNPRRHAALRNVSFTARRWFDLILSGHFSTRWGEARGRPPIDKALRTGEMPAQVPGLQEGPPPHLRKGTFLGAGRFYCFTVSLTCSAPDLASCATSCRACLPLS